MTVVTATSAGAAAEPTVWLCRPGVDPDPCRAPLDTTTVSATNELVVTTGEFPTETLPVDCFYVYPSVSGQTTENSDLTIEPLHEFVAAGQASRFSSVCNVWAPMWRQRTQQSVDTGPRDQFDQIAYTSLRNAWLDYRDHHNQGRPIVFLGHSQGAVFLIQLLQREVDESPALRDRLISAILLGGNVAVPPGEDVGVTFQNIPACRAVTQTGCVIAYATFPSQPPISAVFGLPGQGMSLWHGQTDGIGVEVLCTNPAALDGGAGTLDWYRWIAGRPEREQVTTDWVHFPDMYRGECKQAGRASWLQPDLISPTDYRVRLSQRNGPRFGYHDWDFSVALGNLVSTVQQQVAAYTAPR
jgi:hypothetical protein